MNDQRSTTDQLRGAVYILNQAGLYDAADHCRRVVEDVDRRINLLAAQRIAADSWLQEDRFSEFRAAHGYASVKTNAIPGLSKITPEESYYVWLMIQRGMEKGRQT